jgi:hypothetical protein
LLVGADADIAGLCRQCKHLNFACLDKRVGDGNRVNDVSVISASDARRGTTRPKPRDIVRGMGRRHVDAVVVVCGGRSPHGFPRGSVRVSRMHCVDVGLNVGVFGLIRGVVSVSRGRSPDLRVSHVVRVAGIGNVAPRRRYRGLNVGVLGLIRGIMIMHSGSRASLRVGHVVGVTR